MKTWQYKTTYGWLSLNQTVVQYVDDPDPPDLGGGVYQWELVGSALGGLLSDSQRVHGRFEERMPILWFWRRVVD